MIILKVGWVIFTELPYPALFCFEFVETQIIPSLKSSESFHLHFRWLEPI